jgi:hypothetical protein
VYNIKAQIAYIRRNSSGGSTDWGNMQVKLKLMMSTGGVQSKICERIFENKAYNISDLCDIDDTIALPLNASVWVEWLVWIPWGSTRHVDLVGLDTWFRLHLVN